MRIEEESAPLLSETQPTTYSATNNQSEDNGADDYVTYLKKIEDLRAEFKKLNKELNDNIMLRIEYNNYLEKLVYITGEPPEKKTKATAWTERFIQRKEKLFDALKDLKEEFVENKIMNQENIQEIEKFIQLHQSDPRLGNLRFVETIQLIYEANIKEKVKDLRNKISRHRENVKNLENKINEEERSYQDNIKCLCCLSVFILPVLFYCIPYSYKGSSTVKKLSEKLNEEKLKLKIKRTEFDRLEDYGREENVATAIKEKIQHSRVDSFVNKFFKLQKFTLNLTTPTTEISATRYYKK